MAMRKRKKMMMMVMRIPAASTPWVLTMCQVPRYAMNTNSFI